MSKFYEDYWKNKEILEDFSYKWSAIKKFIPEEKGIKILDFGCGKGRILKEIIKINPGARITGIDVSKTALSYARKGFKTCTFIKIEEGKKLPFKTSTFDFIVALDVLEHIYDTRLAFSELTRVLKPKGKILITVPYYGLIKNIIIAFFAFEFVYTPRTPHIRFYTKRSLIKEMESVGLVKEQFGYYGRFFPISNGMFCLSSLTNK